MWAVRIFKTRTIAAEACKKGRISINGALAKAARTVKPGDVIQVRKPPVTYSFKGLQPIEKRVGAKLVAEKMCIRDSANAGYDPEFGARPVKRAIQHYLLNDLSKKLLAQEVDRSKPIRCV